MGRSLASLKIVEGRWWRSHAGWLGWVVGVWWCGWGLPILCGDCCPPDPPDPTPTHTICVGLVVLVVLVGLLVLVVLVGCWCLVVWVVAAAWWWRWWRWCGWWRWWCW